MKSFLSQPPPSSTFLALNLQFSVLQLSSWPALPQLPEELVKDVARICALLACRPTAGILVPKLVQMPRDQAFDILDKLYVSGNITAWASPNAEAAEAGLAGDSPETEIEDMLRPKPSRSLIGKIWDRLSLRK